MFKVHTSGDQGSTCLSVCLSYCMSAGLPPCLSVCPSACLLPCLPASRLAAGETAVAQLLHCCHNVSLGFSFFFFCSSAKKRQISRSLLFLQIYEKASCSSGILLTRANKASRSLREALTSLCMCASSLFETYFLLLGFFFPFLFFIFIFQVPDIFTAAEMFWHSCFLSP